MGPILPGARSTARPPPTAAQLGSELERRFLPGLPWTLRNLTTSPDGQVGMLMEVPIEARPGDRELPALVQRNLERMAMGLRGFLHEVDPRLEPSRFSAVVFKDHRSGRSWMRWIRSPATASPPGALEDAALAHPAMPRLELNDRLSPAAREAWVRHKSRALKLQERLIDEISGVYPDPLVEVIPRASPAVHTIITIRTNNVNYVNFPHVETYLTTLRNALVTDEFPDLTLTANSLIRLVPGDRPDLPDTDHIDRQIGFSRPPRTLQGTSRRLEGRIREELALHFPQIQVLVILGPSPHPEAYEAIVKLVVKSAADLSHENRSVIRSFMKRVVEALLADEFSHIYLSARSRFVIWSPHENVREGWAAPSVAVGSPALGEPIRPGFHASPLGPPAELRPGYRQRIRLLEPLTSARARVIDTPVAYMIPGEGRQFSARAHLRALREGSFTNVGVSRSLGLSLEYRQKMLPWIEGELRYSGSSIDGIAIDGTDLPDTTRGAGVLTGGFKASLPHRLLGTRFAVGGSLSLISSLDRPLLHPEDHLRLNHFFLAASRRIGPELDVHGSIRRGFASDGGGGDSSDLTSAGLALDWKPIPLARLSLEVLNERISGTGLALYGADLGWSGPTVSAGLTLGIHHLGDVQFAARRLNDPDQAEVLISVTQAF